MKIFVAGATGVVGRRAVPRMIVAGHRVTVAARTAEQEAEAARGTTLPVKVDLFDIRSIRHAVEGQDVVVNLATHMPPSTVRMLLPGAWRENDRIRREGAANLVDAALAAGVGRFVQESFAPVYPDRGDEWIHEDCPIEPVRYNRSVADAEAAAQRFSSNGGQGVVLRFAAFYGPDARQTLDMIELVRKGWAPLPGRPEAFFSSISHDDAATAVVAALGVPAGIYNVADDEPLRRREFADSLARAVGMEPPKFIPSWLTHLTGSLGKLMSRSQRISNRKLRAASGWAPVYPSVRAGWLASLEPLTPGALSLKQKRL